uniref:Putative secreted protein n=1 Tax=Anopheles darlingi TaxID=43151 RepID=A0A2M4DAG9_ANODA
MYRLLLLVVLLLVSSKATVRPHLLTGFNWNGTGCDSSDRSDPIRFKVTARVLRLKQKFNPCPAPNWMRQQRTRLCNDGFSSHPSPSWLCPHRKRAAAAGQSTIDRASHDRAQIADLARDRRVPSAVDMPSVRTGHTLISFPDFVSKSRAEFQSPTPCDEYAILARDCE